MKHCLIFSREIFLSVFSMFKYSMTKSSQCSYTKLEIAAQGIAQCKVSATEPLRCGVFDRADMAVTKM